MAEEKKEWALHLDASEYQDKILKGTLPALVDFWAPWCFPCRMLAPTIEELAKEYEGRVVIAKINTDNNGALANSLNIKGIPTMVLIKDGKNLPLKHPNVDPFWKAFYDAGVKYKDYVG